MARIRTLKPEIWESEKLGRLSLLARLNFIGLISLADDQGRGRGEPNFLMARLHPYAEDVRIPAMKKALNELGEAGLVIFYRDSNCSYYAIPSWSENQKIDRPSVSKLPAPRTTKQEFGEDSTNPQRELSEDSLLDQGSGIKEGTKEATRVLVVERNGMAAGNVTASEAAFRNFWSAYPRKVARQSALKAFLKLGPDKTLLETMLSALEEQKALPNWRKDGGVYVPYPASWLNSRRWEDEIAPGTVENTDHEIEAQKRAIAEKIAARMKSHANV